MTWKRAAKTIVIGTAVAIVLCASAFATAGGQTAANSVNKSHGSKTTPGIHTVGSDGLRDIGRLYAAARRELIEHLEYVIDEIVRRH